MSRTDKDLPWSVREARNEIPPYAGWGTCSGFRKGRKAIKRQGHKNFRNGKILWKDVKTVQATIFYM
jgi:hypothetical protein